MKTKTLYFQIKNDINNNIIKDKLPSEKEMCLKYECSRSTLRIIINKLQDSGLIKSKQGKGHFIQRNLKSNKIKSFIDKQNKNELFLNTIENIKIYNKCTSDYNLSKVIMYNKIRKNKDNKIIETSTVILNKLLLINFSEEKVKKSVLEFLQVDQDIKLSYEQNITRCVKNTNIHKVETSANFLIFSKSIYYNEFDEVVCIIEYFLAPEYFKYENIYYGI